MAASFFLLFPLTFTCLAFFVNDIMNDVNEGDGEVVKCEAPVKYTCVSPGMIPDFPIL